MGSKFHLLSPRHSGALTPTSPTAVRLWETFISIYRGLSFGCMVCANFMDDDVTNEVQSDQSLCL